MRKDTVDAVTHRVPTERVDIVAHGVRTSEMRITTTVNARYSSVSGRSAVPY